MGQIVTAVGFSSSNSVSPYRLSLTSSP